MDFSSCARPMHRGRGARLAAMEVVMRALGWLVCGVCVGSGAAAAGASEAGNGLTAPGWASAAPLSSSLASSDGGLVPSWSSPLRGRLSLGFNAPAAGMALTAAPASLVSARLLGDYYFSRPAAADGRARGFRATSGVLFGSRLAAWGGPVAAGAGALGAATVSVERRSFGLLPGALDAAGLDARPSTTAVPYVGVGYSNAFDSQGRWGISADLGLMALRRQDGGVRLGRALGSQSVDDALRDLRLAPMLQLGVSYSF